MEMFGECKLTLLASLLIVFVLGQAISDYCDSSRSNVTLEILNGEDACPSDPITLRCAVKKSPSSSFLTWKCSSNSSGNLVLCGPILNFTCAFGKVFNISGACQCDGGNVIVSEALFLAKQRGPMTIFCGNGVEEDEKEISVSPRGLHTPELTYTKMSDDQEGPVRVRVMWTTPDSIMKDIMYKLTVQNSSNSTTWTTYQPYWDINVYTGISYNVTVFAERCSGALRSDSNSTAVLVQGQSVTESPSEESGKKIEGSTDRAAKFPSWGIALIVIASLLVLSIVVIAVLVVLFFSIRAKNQDVAKEKSNEEKFPKTTVENEQNNHMAALYVDETHIYFSCCEVRDEKYSIRKYTIQGEHEFGVQGFKHVRGIGVNSQKNFFFADSFNHRVLKFNEQLERVKMSAKFNYPFFGLCVTEDDYVLVCEERNRKIFVFDRNLRLYCKPLQLNQPPIDITMFGGNFFVTTRNAIVVLKIDFERKKLESQLIIDHYWSGNAMVNFEEAHELRSICAHNGKLYVVEKRNRLFCFEYNSEKLSLVAEKKNCRPIVIATNGNNVYCSQICERRFIISEVITTDDCAQLSFRTVIN